MLEPNSLNADSVLQAKPGENEPLGIVLHRDGVVLDLDDDTASIFGYTRQELIGRLLIDLILGVPTNGRLATATAVTRDGQPIPIEILAESRQR